MTRIIFQLVSVSVLLAGIILLQIFLSKKESRFPGLVLPIIAFLFSLLYPLTMTAPSEGANVGFVVQMIAVWLLGNIPTIILLAVYFGCREKRRRNKQLDKMNIQDLN